MSVDPRPRAWAASSRFWTAGKTEAAERRGEGQPGVAADHDQHGGGRHAAAGAPVHLGEEGGREALRLERPGPSLPEARGNAADGGADGRVAHHNEDEGLAVLRRGGVHGRRQDFRHGGVVDIVGPEAPGGTLGQHHVEELGHRGDGTGRPPDWAG